MSLSRLALRLAAIEALLPSALVGTGPYPTFAGPRVFDSRIEPIADADAWGEFLAAVEGEPIASVYTEQQETEPTEGEYPADREFVDLVVELMIAAAATVETQGPDGQPITVGSLEAAITSAEHEAMLDMLEQQVRDLLVPTSPTSPPLYTKIAWELHHVRSAPIRDAEGRLSRVAARTVTFRLRVPRARAADEPAPGVDPDIAGLPQPLLGVALALPKESPGGQLLRHLARGQAPPPAYPRLADIRVFSNLDRGVAPTAKQNDLVSDARL